MFSVVRNVFTCHFLSLAGDVPALALRLRIGGRLVREERLNICKKALAAWKSIGSFGRLRWFVLLTRFPLSRFDMSDEELMLCIRLTKVWDIGRPQVTMARALTVVGLRGIVWWSLSRWWT